MPYSRVVLAAYTVRVREKRQRVNYAKLDMFDGESDFLAVCQDFLKNQRLVQEHDSEARQLLNLHDFCVEGRNIAGIIRCGSYGQACEVIDAISASVVYNKRTTDADMLPFYFRIDVPVDTDEGLLIVQRGTSGAGGIKTGLVKGLSKYFDQHFPEYKLDFGPLLPADVVKTTVDKGSIRRIRFVHFGLPTDIASRYGSGHSEHEGSMELVIRAKRNSALPLKDKLASFISAKKKNIGEFYELKDINFDVNEVKVELKVGRQTRTVKLGELSSSPLYDVTSDVTFSEDGNPEFKSVHAAAEQLSEELRVGIYGDARK